MGREMGERLKRVGIYVYLWLIHAKLWQKTAKVCKAIMLQLKKKKRMERCDLTEVPGRLWVGLLLGRGKDWVLADFVQAHVWCTWLKIAMPGWSWAQPLCTRPASHHLELQCCVQCFITWPASSSVGEAMLGTLLRSVGCVACAWSRHPMSKWN